MWDVEWSEIRNEFTIKIQLLDLMQILNDRAKLHITNFHTFKLYKVLVQCLSMMEATVPPQYHWNVCKYSCILEDLYRHVLRGKQTSSIQSSLSTQDNGGTFQAPRVTSARDKDINSLRGCRAQLRCWSNGNELCAAAVTSGLSIILQIHQLRIALSAMFAANLI